VHRRRFLQHTTHTALAFGVLRHLGACRPRGEGDAAFRALRDRYFLEHLELNPVTSTYLGGDGYDASLATANGRLRDWSSHAVAHEIRRWREIDRSLGALDAAGLGDTDRVDHAVTRAQVRYVLHQLDDRRYHERSVDTYVAEPFRGVDWQIQQMSAAGEGMLGTEAEWSLVVDRLRAVPSYVAVARENLRAGRSVGNLPDRRMVERDGIAGSRANAEYFAQTLPATATRLLGGRAFAGAMAGRIADAGRAAAEAYRGLARGLWLCTTPARPRRLHSVCSRRLDSRRPPQRP
jgi:uncharacterized protein (DUF885 family)